MSNKDDDFSKIVSDLKEILKGLTGNVKTMSKEQFEEAKKKFNEIRETVEKDNSGFLKMVSVVTKPLIKTIKDNLDAAEELLIQKGVLRAKPTSEEQASEKSASAQAKKDNAPPVHSSSTQSEPSTSKSKWASSETEFDVFAPNFSTDYRKYMEDVAIYAQSKSAESLLVIGQTLKAVAKDLAQLSPETEDEEEMLLQVEIQTPLLLKIVDRQLALKAAVTEEYVNSTDLDGTPAGSQSVKNKSVTKPTVKPAVKKSTQQSKKVTKTASKTTSKTAKEPIKSMGKTLKKDLAAAEKKLSELRNSTSTNKSSTTKKATPSEFTQKMEAHRTKNTNTKSVVKKATKTAKH